MSKNKRGKRRAKALTHARKLRQAAASPDAKIKTDRSRSATGPVGTQPERPKLHLQLNLDAVLAPTQIAVVTSSEVVDLFFNAMATADLSKKPENDATRYKFNSPDQSAQDRRSAFESWIFSKAFQDLMRGVRGSLEQAYFLQELAKIRDVKSAITLDDLLAPLYKRASDLNFPDLLENVNAQLREPLNFSDAFNSLQKARNCYEHRAGVVGKKDVSPDGLMKLHFPIVKVAYLRGGQEVELVAGQILDTHEADRDEKLGVQILHRIDLRHREYKLGERLSLTLVDFNEIAFACHFFSTELVHKLIK